MVSDGKTMDGLCELNHMKYIGLYICINPIMYIVKPIFDWMMNKSDPPPKTFVAHEVAEEVKKLTDVKYAGLKEREKSDAKQTEVRTENSEDSDMLLSVNENGCMTI